MPERVALHRIIHGSGDERVIIEAGTRFQTEDIGLSAADVKAYEERGAVRKVRTSTVLAPAIAGPSDGSSQAEAAPKPSAEDEGEKHGEELPHRGRRRGVRSTTDDDLEHEL